MPRRYVSTEAAATVTAASDLFQVKNASGSSKLVKVIRWWWSPAENTLPTAQIIQIRCRVLPATVTDGSGGSTPVPRPLDPGDSAATFTVLSLNTTKAATSGTARVYDERGSHVFNGYEGQPEEPAYVPPASSFVFELTNSVLQGALKLSLGVEIEELG